MEASSHHCVTLTHRAGVCRRDLFFFSACAMRRRKGGKIRAVHVDGRVRGRHADAQRGTEACTHGHGATNVAPGARRAGSGTLESVLIQVAPATATATRSHHSCWRAWSMGMGMACGRVGDRRRRTAAGPPGRQRLEKEVGTSWRVRGIRPSHPKFFHPSHQNFGHMHGILNVHKK
jgi:hypothetical protein